MFLWSFKEWNIILCQFCFFYKNTMLSESIEMQMNILTPFSKTGIVAGFCWISVLNLLAEWSYLLVCMHLKKFNQTRIIITLFKMSSKPLIWLYVSLRIRDFSSVLSSMYNIHVIQTTIGISVVSMLYKTEVTCIQSFKYSVTLRHIYWTNDCSSTTQ